jgi:vacuolar iron transporter family protein
VTETTSDGRTPPTPDPSRIPPEDHHRDVSGGWLRPTVFGAMDGLVTNASLIAGVGGSGASRNALVITGLAGLVSGAFSMAAGEWTSVRSQNQMLGAELDKERLELARNPSGEAAELAEALTRHGISLETATAAAEEISRDSDVALRFHAREELGIDPEETPSPWTAAGSSFVAFAIGALVPLLPLLLGLSSLTVPLVVSAVAAFLGGVLLSRVTGRRPLTAGAQQLLLAAGAAGVTYAVGRLIGGSIT